MARAKLSAYFIRYRVIYREGVLNSQGNRMKLLFN